jgi:competence protein ComEC
VATRGVSAVVEATSVWPVDEDPGWIGRVHRRTDAALGYGLHPREAAVARGMVLGDRSLIPEELEEDFRRSGITHTLSISPTLPEHLGLSLTTTLLTVVGGEPVVDVELN